MSDTLRPATPVMMADVMQVGMVWSVERDRVCIQMPESGDLRWVPASCIKSMGDGLVAMPPAEEEGSEQ